jgi:hypothetical protein
MPILTIESIRENPWSVLTHSLPKRPTQLLLQTAHLAAVYCRESEYALTIAAHDGHYTPLGWYQSEDNPDVHEESEARSLDADCKRMEICDLCERRFGVVLDPDDREKRKAIYAWRL